MTTLPELLRALDDDFDNLAHWHPLADFLSEQGDPRGELIVIDLALEAGEGDTEALTARRAAILAESSPKLLGDVFSRVIADGYGEVEWRRGFVDSVSYRGSTELRHKKSVGWLVKLMTTQHEPFALLRAIDFSHTDIVDLKPLQKFPHLVKLTLTGCSPSKDSLAELEQLRPLLRRKGGR